MIYVDPPFNTGRPQARASLRAVADPEGTRTGFAGRRYRTEKVDGPPCPTPTRSTTSRPTWSRGWCEARRLLAPHGTLYVHLDPRESHYVKVLLDEVFGRDVLPQRVDLGL